MEPIYAPAYVYEHAASTWKISNVEFDEKKNTLRIIDLPGNVYKYTGSIVQEFLYQYHRQLNPRTHTNIYHCFSVAAGFIKKHQPE